MAWSKNQGKFAKENGEFAKVEGNKAKDAAKSVEVAIAESEKVTKANKTKWLPAVATVALRNSIYPNPSNGDTVRVTGDTSVYRYDTVSGWVKTDEYNPTAIDQVTSQLADTAKKSEVETVKTNVATLTTKKADVDYVNQKVQAANLAYKESYATLTELQTKYPTGDNYNHVVLSDGMIYTYVNSTWTNTKIQANGTGIADNTISKSKLTFLAIEGVQSKNLFDKTKITANSYLRNDNGQVISSGGSFVSDFIEVIPSTNYYLDSKHSTRRVVFYNENKSFISGTVDGVNAITTPITAKYARIASNNTVLNSTQLEIGSSFSGFEAYETKFNYGLLEQDKIPGNTLLTKSVDESKLKNYSKTKNLFNKSSATIGYYVQAPNGVLAANNTYFTSEYIEVEANTEYCRTRVDQMCFYNSEKVFISGLTYGAPKNFTTPSNCKYIRVCDLLANIDTYQVELGNTSTSYEPFGYRLKNLILDAAKGQTEQTSYKRFLNLFDAWVSWKNNEKFPIAFYGDSTFDGATTTGWFENTVGTDHNPPNAFAKKSETLFRNVTGNASLRIYNAGFNGRTASQGISYFEQEFTGTAPYKDVKMIGIGFGINDRTLYSTEKGYRDGFKTNIKAIIEKCYKNGIQPFLLTTQATIEPSVWTIYEANYPLRTSGHIETIANKVKRELAWEYGLELIDITEFTERFLMYSSYSAKTITSDRLHFGDIGHKYESEILFAHIVPLVNWIDGYEKIDYSTQKIVKAVPENKLTIPDTVTDAFKVYANYTKEDGVDTKIFEVYIFVDTKKQVTIKAFKNTTDSLTYVKVNGVQTTLTGLEDTIGSLDLGLHKIEVFSGASNIVDFKGFIIE